jgi:hypothetical protein
MKNAHLTVLAGTTLLFGLLPANASVARAPQSQSAGFKIVVTDSAASDLNCPCEVQSFVGNVYRYDQPVEKGMKLPSLDGIQFSTTKDVVVVTGTPQTSAMYYVVPRSYSADARKLPCNSPLADCNPVVKDGLGQGLFTWSEQPYEAVETSTLQAKAAPSMYEYRVEPLSVPHTAAGSNIRLLIPHTPDGDYSGTASDKFRYIRMQE